MNFLGWNFLVPYRLLNNIYWGGNCVADRPETTLNIIVISATFNSSFLECWPFQIIQNFRESSSRGAINNQSKARARRTLA